MRREADGGVTLESADHGLISALVDLTDHPAEIADRLVVVEDERERDARRHRGAAAKRASWMRPRPFGVPRRSRPPAGKAARRIPAACGSSRIPTRSWPWRPS